MTNPSCGVIRMENTHADRKEVHNCASRVLFHGSVATGTVKE